MFNHCCWKRRCRRLLHTASQHKFPQMKWGKHRITLKEEKYIQPRKGHDFSQHKNLLSYQLCYFFQWRRWGAGSGWGGLFLDLYQLRKRLAIFFSVGNVEFKLSSASVQYGLFKQYVILRSQYTKNAIIVLFLRGQSINLRVPPFRGSWAIQSVKHPTGDFGSSHALMGHGIEPRGKLHALLKRLLESLCIPVSQPPPTLSLSNK